MKKKLTQNFTLNADFDFKPMLHLAIFNVDIFYHFDLACYYRLLDIIFLFSRRICLHHLTMLKLNEIPLQKDQG